MDDRIWRSSAHRGATPSGATARTIDAVSEGRRGGLFPTVAEPVDDVVAPVRELAGDRDAEFLSDALRGNEFEPFRSALDTIDGWCAARRPDLVAAPLVSLDNDALFGPLCRELFTVCAANRLPNIADYCGHRVAGHLDHLESFLDRLHTDRHQLRDHFGLIGPVVELSAQGHETHNHGRQVLRLADPHGTAIAYKPRPAAGEALFLPPDTGGDTPDSVFALLNRIAGADTLPTLRCLRRDAWLWQEWVTPTDHRPIHRTPDLTLHGPVSAPTDAGRLWRRAGSLTAAVAGFGIEDLTEGNILVGRNGSDPEPRHHIVDLEIFGGPLDHLARSQLIAGAGSNHHAGFENRPRVCGVDLPLSYFDTDLELRRPRRPWARTHTDTVIADTHGRFGYGPYLPQFLRGAFDLWTVLCEHRDEIADFVAARDGGFPARVLERTTGEYAAALTDRLLTGAPLPDEFSGSERAQLESGDVPYYFTVPGTKRTSDVDGPVDDVRAEPPSGPRSGDWDLSGFGRILPGVLDYAESTTPMTGEGVRTGAYEAAFDWPGFDTRLVYFWDGETIRCKTAELTEPEPVTEFADRLRRIDAADAVLRSEWVSGGQSDADLEAQLAALVDGAIDWFESVVDEHGWPTAEMVGADAAAAATRLLQHTGGALEFRKRCLRELEAAAAHGRAELSDVAFVTDTLCIDQGLSQRYGTKFERRDGVLVPCRIADPATVETDRARMGLSTLDEYTVKIRERFDPVPRPSGAA